MVRRWWKWLLPAACAAALLVASAWVCDRSAKIAWVGNADLDIEFVVTEAGSGSPIAGARVEAQSEGGFYEERGNFYEERGKQEFVVVSDAGGVAHGEYRRVMSFGTRSRLGFTDTYDVHLPSLRFRVAAPGYQPSGWIELWEYRRQVKRAGPGRARLTVPVPLTKGAG
jgi:hypothetical protein